MMSVISVYTINDELMDFHNLFSIWKAFKESTGDVELDFTYCYFLRQNAVAFLGGMARIAEQQGRRLIFRWNTMRNAIYRNLEINGFTSVFQNGAGPESAGNAIPYREDFFQNPASIMRYLDHDWLGRGWVHVSPRVKDAIIGKVWESYANAFEHGESEIGVISCGQHFPNMHELKLTVMDFGVGIPVKVRRYLSADTLSAADALRWAFGRGNSTKTDYSTGPRGLGLDFLKEFVRINKGRLEVFSHDGYVQINDQHETYNTINNSFRGTIINITIRCDESYYHFASESTTSGPLF